MPLTIQTVVEFDDNPTLKPTDLGSSKLHLTLEKDDLKQFKNNAYNCQLEALKKTLGKCKPSEQTQATCFAMLSGLMMTLYSTFYGWIDDSIDISTILMLRGLIQIVLMIILNFVFSGNYRPIPPATQIEDIPTEKLNRASAYLKRHWVLSAVALMSVASFIGGLRLTFIFLALHESPMGSVHSIIQGGPVLVMVIGHFFLGDRMTIIRCLSALGLMTGIFLIAKPSSFTEGTEEEMSVAIGHCFAVGALVLSAIGACLTKPLSSIFSRMSISLYLGIFIFIVGVAMCGAIDGFAPKLPADGKIWSIAFFVGLLGVSQQLCLIAAIKIGSPARVTLIRSLQIALSFLIQVYGLNQPAKPTEIIGASIILLTVGITSFERQILALLGYIPALWKKLQGITAFM